MPPASGWRFWVSVHSMNCTPLIQVVMVGGFETILARSSFHCPWRQNDAHDAGSTGNAIGALVTATIRVTSPSNRKFINAGFPPNFPSP